VRAARRSLTAATSCRYSRLAYERAGSKGPTPNGPSLRSGRTSKHSRNRDKTGRFANFSWCPARPSHKLHLATGNMFIADESSSIVAMRSLSIHGLSNFASRQAQPLRMLFQPDNIVPGENRTATQSNDSRLQGQKSGLSKSGIQSRPLICKLCVIADLRRRKRKLHHHTFMYLHWHSKIL
jgi:hypothetical protein